jgi:UDP-N-acetylmuramate--alanine ligase
MKNGSYEFDVVVNENKLEHVMLHMGGMHNVENAVAAITVVSSLEIGNDKIKAGIESFKGVKRRFEYIVKNGRIVFIDDYAHHPEELRALINGAKSLFRQRKCTIIFQPHLYTRTRDLADGFAEVLELADDIILLPIYPAREEPIKGVTSEMILKKIKNQNKRVLDKQELLRWIESDYSKNINTEFGQVLITAGAGDIDMMIEPIKAIMKKI